MRPLYVTIALLTLVFSSRLLADEAPRARDTEPSLARRSQAIGTTRLDLPVEVPPPSEKALQYFHSGNVLWVVGELWVLAVPAVLLVTGISARLRDVAWRIGRRWFFAVGLYVVFYILLNALIDFPLLYYVSFVRPHAYGLTDQPFAKWFMDASIRLLVGLVEGFLFAWIPFLLMARRPRTWWLYTAALAVPLALFTLLVKPVWYDPLFNRYGPMYDKALEARILALADRAGIEGGRVYEVDKSADTKTLNAYVTGFLGTKRIVLWDNLLAKMSDDEVLAVMGHEMGHFVLGHVVIGTLLGCALGFVGLGFVHVASGFLIRRFGGRWGIDRRSDFASLPLLLLLAEVFAMATSPLSLAVSRHMEHEADRFALEITRDNHACAIAFVTMQHDNLSVPRPGWLYKVFRSTHPPIGERIDFSNTYRPWARGVPGRYDAHFRKLRARPVSPLTALGG